jgi:hypothetical protein
MTDAISAWSQHLGSNADTAITRRKFVVTTLAVGFALAARPLSAETHCDGINRFEGGRDCYSDQ